MESAGDAAGDEKEVVEAESMRSWHATGSSRAQAQAQADICLLSMAAASGVARAPDPEHWSGGGAIVTSGPWSRRRIPARRRARSGSDPRMAARAPRICARLDRDYSVSATLEEINLDRGMLQKLRCKIVEGSNATRWIGSHPS